MDGRENAERPSLDEWLMEIARQVARRSTWPGMRVGCVAARDGRVVSAGYNGTPRKWRGETGREAKPVYCHAEENAVANAARFGTALEGCVFYTTLSPCVQCARMMVNAGAAGIVWAEDWDDPEGMRVVGLMCRDAAVAWRRI